MSDMLANIVDSIMTPGIAVGGTVVAIAITLMTVKVMGRKSSNGASGAIGKKKKKKATSAKKSKKKASTDIESVDKDSQSPKTEKINFQDFVADWPDSEEEEASRVEKKRLRRKMKKKKGKSSKSAVSDSEVVDGKLDFVASNAKDVDDGWETVSRRKAKQKN